MIKSLQQLAERSSHNIILKVSSYEDILNDKQFFKTSFIPLFAQE